MLVHTAQSEMEYILDSREEFQAAAGMYQLLGRLWLKEVDQPLLGQLLQEPLRSAFHLAQYDAAKTDDAIRDHVDHLAAEYCRLFVGPRGHFPPMQSVWQQGQLDSETVSSVRSFAETIGYEPAENYPEVFMDHLGVQLEIMGRVYEVFQQQNVTTLALARLHEDGELFQFGQTFFHRHLCWTEKLTSNAMKECEEGSLYHSLLSTTQSFLELEFRDWSESEQKSA